MIVTRVNDCLWNILWLSFCVSIFFTSSLSVQGKCPSFPFQKTVDIPDTAWQEALATVNASLHTVIDPIIQPGFAASIWYRGAPVLSWGGGVADRTTGRIPNAHTDLFRYSQ